MAENYLDPNLNHDDTDDEEVPIEFPPSLGGPTQVLPPNDSADDSIEESYINLPSPYNFYSGEGPPDEPTSASEIAPNTIETHGSRAEAWMSLLDEDSASFLYDIAHTTGAMQGASQYASSATSISDGLHQHPPYDRHPPPRVAIQPVTILLQHPFSVQGAHYQPEPLMEGMSHPQQDESQDGTQECVPSGARFDQTERRFSGRQMP